MKGKPSPVWAEQHGTAYNTICRVCIWESVFGIWDGFLVFGVVYMVSRAQDATGHCIQHMFLLLAFGVVYLVFESVVGIWDCVFGLGIWAAIYNQSFCFCCSVFCIRDCVFGIRDCVFGI